MFTGIVGTAQTALATDDLKGISVRMKLGFLLPICLTPSVLASEVLGLCYYGAHLIPVFWHGAL